MQKTEAIAELWRRENMDGKSKTSGLSQFEDVFKAYVHRVELDTHKIKSTLDEDKDGIHALTTQLASMRTAITGVQIRQVLQEAQKSGDDGSEKGSRTEDDGSDE